MSELTPLHLKDRKISRKRANDGRWYSDGRTEVGASGGTAALSYHVDAWEEGATLTLETDGTYDFGDEVPELVFFADARLANDGEQLDETQVRLGSGVSATLQGTGGPSGYEVEESSNTAVLPGGKGFKAGTNSEDDLNSSSIDGRWRCDFDAHVKGFESRITYMPDEHVQAIYDLITNPETIPGGTDISDSSFWQMKQLWNAANEGQAGVQDQTDFFINGRENRNRAVGELGDFRRTLLLSTNESSITSGALNNNFGSDGIDVVRGTDEPPRRVFGEGDDTMQVPLDTPYTLEFAYNQNDVSQTDTGEFYVNYSNLENGEEAHLRAQGVTLHARDADNEGDKIVNGFTLPGFVRGFPHKFNCHWLYQDIFKQKGWAHVSICDGPDYFQAKRRTHLIPVSWSPGKAEVELRGGWWDVGNLTGKHICIIGPDYEQVASVEIA